MIYEFEATQDLHGYARPWPAGGGANKWDEVWELGTITNEGAPASSTTAIRSKNHISASAETKYYIVTPATMTVHYYEEDDTYISNESVTASKEITTPADCAYMLFCMANTYGTEYKHDIAVNYPSTVTTYSPYENICPIEGVEIPGIGTVYAGSLDTGSRKLTITHVIADLSSLTWVYDSSASHERFQATLSTVKPAGGSVASLWCNVYKVISAADLYLHTNDCSVAVHDTLSQVWVYDSRYTDAAAFKTASTGNKIVYQLLTPNEVILTENQIAVMLVNLGIPRNFGNRSTMLNVWMKLAQGQPIPDDMRRMLRPTMQLPDDAVLRPTFEDYPDLRPEPDPVPDVVDTPAAEPEENITESEES